MGFKDLAKTFINEQQVITAHVDRYLMGLNYVEKSRRKYCHHPSQLGKCPRKLQYEFLDYPKTRIHKPQTQFVFAVGHALQEVYVQFLIGSGFCKREHIEYAMHNDELNVHGHADIYVPEKGIGADLKTIRVNDKNEISYWVDGQQIFVPWKEFTKPHEDYEWQMHSYMLCDDNAKQWQIVYLNKNDQTVKEFHIPRDESKLAELRRKIQEVNLALAERRLLPRPLGYMPMTVPCAWCEYKDVCWDDTVKPNFKVMDEIDAGIIDLKTGKRLDENQEELDV